MDKEKVHTLNAVLYSLRREGILPFATTWLSPKDIMLSEISQAQKDKYCIISSMWNLQKSKFVVTESRVMVTRDLRGQKNGRCWSTGTTLQL